MSERKIDRRDFIKGAVITGAGLALGGGLFYGRRALAALLSADQGDVDRAIRDHKLGQMSDADAQAVVEAYMTSGPGKPKVVHVHSSQATNWNFNTGYYGDYVDQDVVNSMVDQGVMELTGASTVAGAWSALIPGYAPGNGIAIKVSHNNAWSCDISGLDLDGLIHPVNAVVRGLKQMGVAEDDIWVYEAVRRIPDRFVAGCLYPNVQFFGVCRQLCGWDSDNPDAFVTFNPPSAPVPPPIRIPDVLINATYLINMPIIKTHASGVSLSFKNHFGTINNPGALHDYIIPGWTHFSTDYSPFVDIHQNPHIGAKTILTIGDGLFGGWAGYNVKPETWTTFGNAASNSLFFATDPVALDCVMYDLLAAETTIIDDADVYLSVAADAGLGVFEHGDPGGSGYSQIDYDRVEV